VPDSSRPCGQPVPANVTFEDDGSHSEAVLLDVDGDSSALNTAQTAHWSQLEAEGEWVASHQPTRLIEECIETVGFARKKEDDREADRRLGASRHLSAPAARPS
jgi:hypothetical protein